MSTLHGLAASIVDAMTQLGARFELEPAPSGETWVWYAKPASQRDAVAACWEAADKPPGIRAAMTAEIRRRQGGGAL